MAIFKKIINKLSSGIAGGAIIISFFSVCSRFLGLFRDHLLAGQFGAGNTLDAYYAAFKLPDLIFNTLVLGALNAAFVPIFLEQWSKNKEKAWQIVNSFLNFLFLALFGLTIIFFIFAPQLVSTVVAPGFDAQTKEVTVSLTRMMLLSILFFGISNVAGGILNSFKKFFAYSLAPIMYNLGIIFGILFLVPKLGNLGLAMGVVLGSFFHLFVQIPSIFKLGYKWEFNFNFYPEVKKIIILMIPRFFALGASQVSKLITTIIASTLVTGSLAIYNLADNLQSFPIGIFGISLAISAFPYFSECVTNGDLKKFSDHFSLTFRRILFLIIPSSVLMILLRSQIVRLVLGSGLFSWRDTALTLNTLGFFVLSLFAQALIPLLARAFYAFQNTKTPLFINIFSIVINIFLAIIFGRSMGVAGLALAFSIANIINFILLFSALRFKAKLLGGKKIIISLFKITLASIAMIIIVQVSKNFIGTFVDMKTFMGVLIQFISSSLLGVLAFLIISFLLKSEEISILNNLFLKRPAIFKNSPPTDSSVDTL